MAASTAAMEAELVALGAARWGGHLTITHYLPLDKMVVNFPQKGSARFLQVEMQFNAN